MFEITQQTNDFSKKYPTADVGNWSIAVEDVPEGTTDVGTGGFMPFGISGVLTGAATCFYAFVGFDAIATTGEEAKKPQKNIPWAIIISLGIVFLAYFAISTVLTLMWPYYDQVSTITSFVSTSRTNLLLFQNPEAPFPYVFDKIGWTAVKWIVNIGAVFALCTSMLGAMFPLPRILYAMSNDGLLFKSLSKVNAKTQTPLVGTIVAGVLSGESITLRRFHSQS